MGTALWIGGLALAAVASVALLPRLLLDPFLRAMLRPPVRRPRALPEDLARTAEDVTIPGPRMPMRAWLLRAGGGGGHGLAVFVHGWSSDAGRMAPLAAHVLQAGVSCLLLDLPGHGRTGPTPGYHAALMVEDLRAVAGFVAGRPDLAEARAGLVGYSFGGIGALVSAAVHGAWGALVVMATPVGPMAATEIYLEGKGLPARRLRGPLRRAAARLVGVDPHTFDGDRHLPGLRIPVLFVHGSGDTVVPPRHAEALHAAAPPALRELLLVEGADHDGLLGHPDAGRRVAAFLSRTLRGV